jgi:type II secretory pathway pseudopilin PulG
MRQLARLAVLGGLAAGLLPSAGADQSEDRARLQAFANPERVAIQGYDDDAMEPFLTRDGHFLLFNNRNDPPEKTDLFYAERIDDLTFAYRGPIQGANSDALDAVASMDRAGNLYFISTRSYAETLSTIYRGRFQNGVVTGVELVAGVSRRIPGMVNFDAEISADGDTLFFVDGVFNGGPVPAAADLVMARRRGARFERLSDSGRLLRQVNTKALEYAPATSADGLELFFTRLDGTVPNPQPAIYRTTRKNPQTPFGPPERIAAIQGFAEAPTLSPDGRSLYYHMLENGRFVIYRVTR